MKSCRYTRRDGDPLNRLPPLPPIPRFLRWLRSRWSEVMRWLDEAGPSDPWGWS
jgi:hypothetical protein